MKANSVLRDEAWFSLRGKWATSALFAFVYLIFAGLLNAVCTLPFGTNAYASNCGSIIGSILICPMTWGFTVAFLRQFRGEEQQLGWLFSPYSQTKVWTTEILKAVYTLLWCLLLIIPGIVKGYSYAMTEFLMQDNPELKDNAAIEESMRLMKGRKMKLFLLDLSFIGWVILSLLTLGIALFWIIPYIESAHAAFYEDAKQEYYGVTE